jgi:hypothetical protein
MPALEKDPSASSLDTAGFSSKQGLARRDMERRHSNGQIR